MRFALAIITLFCFNNIVVARERIVGGTAVAQGEFPFYVWTSGSLLCGGSLIWGDFVLTAAHCAQAYNSTKNIRIGTVTRFSGSLLPIDKIISHPEFDCVTMSNDIMLVKLKQYSSQNQYVTLNNEPAIPVEGASVTAMGYGSDGIQAWTQSLTKVNMNSVGYDTCASVCDWMLDDTQMTCTGGSPEGGKDTCAGDSGGPVLLEGTATQIGIVSWGVGCAEPEIPSVNTRVSTYVPWIQEQICLYSTVTPPWNCPLKAIASLPLTNAPIRKPPTQKPVTKKPTNAPVKKPTRAPVNKPTQKPVTKKPTKFPVNKPTRAPVNKPTQKPVTKKPTKVPVNKPTRAPVNKPTQKPITKRPSKAPVNKPTRAPVTKKPFGIAAPVTTATTTLIGMSSATTTTTQCRMAGSQCLVDSQCCGTAPNRCALVPGQIVKQCMIEL
jgi:trypsin